MEIEITTPEKMQVNSDLELNAAIMQFENQFQQEEKGASYYHIVIFGELSIDLCKKIEDAYVAAGWNYVKCKTSSMNGEKPGLTGLQLSMTQKL